MVCHNMERGTLPMCTVAVDYLDFTQIMSFHQQSGHPSLKHTLYFVNQVDPAMYKAAVKKVVG